MERQRQSRMATRLGSPMSPEGCLYGRVARRYMLILRTFRWRSRFASMVLLAGRDKCSGHGAELFSSESAQTFRFLFWPNCRSTRAPKVLFRERMSSTCVGAWGPFSLPPTLLCPRRGRPALTLALSLSRRGAAFHPPSKEPLRGFSFRRPGMQMGSRSKWLQCP